MLSTDGLNYRCASVKLIAAGLVLGLHLGVLGLVLAAPTAQSEIQPSDASDVRMVEISMDQPEAAPDPAPVKLPTAAPIVEEAPPVEPLPEVTPEPPPEPVVDTSAVDPQKLPVVELPAEEKKMSVPPKPRKHERKPEHKTRPKSVFKSTPRPKSVKAEAESGAVASTAKTVADASASAPLRAAQPDQPRLIGRIDYLGRRPIPVYPRLSERRGEQGRVIVRVLISAQGSVASASVRKSSGYSRLDAAAVDAVRSARFKPYTENGIAHAAMADIPFDFVL